MKKILLVILSLAAVAFIIDLIRKALILQAIEPDFSTATFPTTSFLLDKSKWSTNKIYLKLGNKKGSVHIDKMVVDLYKGSTLIGTMTAKDFSIAQNMENEIPFSSIWYVNNILDSVLDGKGWSNVKYTTKVTIFKFITFSATDTL